MDFHKTILSGVKTWAENEFGGAPSWNDLTHKPFDMKKAMILPETTVAPNMEDGGMLFSEPLPGELEAGKTYVVNWRGAKYECVAGEVSLDVPCPYLGNAGALGAEGIEDTGEPFMFFTVPSAYAPSMGFYGGVYALDGSVDATISVDYVEVIKKIDPEVLPEDYINSLIDAKIAAIPRAEEASF